MKKAIVLLILITSMVSCDTDKDTGIDFYNTAHRVGIWVNSDRSDTLEFVDDSNLIRRGYLYSENYLYRINKNILHINLPNSEPETQHPILTVEENSVKLGNMYITTGMLDNSGTFYKIE